MVFDKIPALADPDKMMEQALRAARRKKVSRRRLDSAVVHERKKQRERLTAITTDLSGRLKQVSRVFPSIDDLSEFYRELLLLEFSIDDYRVRLARIQKSCRVLASLSRTFRGKIEAAQTADAVREVMRSAHGRIASVLDRLADSFAFLERVRLYLKELPTLKERFTVCIAGFPNVGKTTLFCELTQSKAEINHYAFTTKRLNVASARFGYRWVQFIDTPGTLNRDRMNDIELQAEYALKYAADFIIYVYDPTHTYSLEKQDALREHMDSFGVPVMNFLSKRDLVDDEVIAGFVADRGVEDLDVILDDVRSRLKKYV